MNEKTADIHLELMERLAEDGRTDALKKAIDDGFNPLTKDSSVLAWAALGGHDETVKFLIPLTKPLDQDSRALSLAAKGGHLGCLRLLLPVSDPSAAGSSALRMALKWGHWECSEILFPLSDTNKVRETLSDEGEDHAVKMLDELQFKLTIGAEVLKLTERHQDFSKKPRQKTTL